MTQKYKFVPLTTYQEFPSNKMVERSQDFYDNMTRRKTIRQFSDKEVPREIIENCIKAAGTAPSGANMQPWHFVVVSDPEIKKQIRIEAEKVEKEFYEQRAPQYWLDALAPLGTDKEKPYLEKAPYLIVIFNKRHTIEADGTIKKNYYLSESVGIATGMLITAVHNAGLCCLTHTPSPMAFLRDILGRPKSESPFLLLVVGYPDEKVEIPDIHKKELEEISSWI